MLLNSIIFPGTGGLPVPSLVSNKIIGTAGPTAAIDTTGATLLVVATAYSTSFSGITGVSDSKSNTWTALTEYKNGTTSTSRLFYCSNPTVGTGHTFSTVGGFSNTPAIAVQAWKGTVLSVSADFDTGAAALNPGSGTPSTNNQVIVTTMDTNVSAAYTVGSGFTISDQINFSGGVNPGFAMAYLIQSAAAAVNPTWTGGASPTPTTAMTSFK